MKYCLFFLAPNTRDLDVFLRKQESGFGFRVLGGDGPDQPVSETAHSFLIVLLLEWSYSVIFISHHPIQAVQWWQNGSIRYLPFRDEVLIQTTFSFSPLCGLQCPRLCALPATKPILGWSFLSGWGHWWYFYRCCCVSEASEGPCWCSAFVHCHLIPVVALAQDVPRFNDWCAVHRNASWEAAEWKEAVAPSVKISLGRSSSCSPVKWGLRWWHGPFIPCSSDWIFKQTLRWRQLSKCQHRHPCMVSSPRAGFRRLSSIFKYAYISLLEETLRLVLYMRDLSLSC